MSADLVGYVSRAEELNAQHPALEGPATRKWLAGTYCMSPNSLPAAATPYLVQLEMTRVGAALPYIAGWRDQALAERNT